jgi:Ca-activated chloride channel family protein
MEFGAPIWLLGLPAVVALLFYQCRAVRRRAVPLACVPLLGTTGWSARWWWLPAALRAGTLVLLLIGLARPRIPDETTKIFPQGASLVLAVDISLSMVVNDFSLQGRDVSRLEAVIHFAQQFVEGKGGFLGRAADEIGIVAFANFPEVRCPPTLTHDVVIRQLRRLRPAPTHEQGTNIGDALILAADLLKHSTSPTKVIVLLSDGVNEPAPLPGAPEPIDPIEAARLCQSLGIRIYCIGTGRWSGRFFYRDPDSGLLLAPEARPMDRKLLSALAMATGGKFFAAEDAQALRAVWQEIDRMELGPVGPLVYRGYLELFPWLGWPALVLLLLEQWARATRWRWIGTAPASLGLNRP